MTRDERETKKPTQVRTSRGNFSDPRLMQDDGLEALPLELVRGLAGRQSNIQHG
jgi:hypothetical protein